VSRRRATIIPLRCSTRLPYRSPSLFPLLLPRPPRSTLFPYTTLFRSIVYRNAITLPFNVQCKVLPHDSHSNNTDLCFFHFKASRSEEHTSELQSRFDLVCRLLLEKKKQKNIFNKRQQRLRN